MTKRKSKKRTQWHVSLNKEEHDMLDSIKKFHCLEDKAPACRLAIKYLYEDIQSGRAHSARRAKMNLCSPRKLTNDTVQ